MDQKKIGKFIAQLRKKKSLTQRELANKLGISEKTVSKWECGNGMPEVAFMQPLCDILGITVNELLTGENLNITELLCKLDISHLDIMRQLEYEQLKFCIYKLYGLEIEGAKTSNSGAGSLTYFIKANNQKFVVKFASDNEMNHPEIEPQLCEYLRGCGIPASEFIKNLQGGYISMDENGRRFHIQKYIEGVTYSYNNAPDFLYEEAATLLAKIHNTLKNYSKLPVGIGEDFFNYRKPENMIASFKKSLQLATNNHDDDNARDIRDILEILNGFPKYTFDISKFTYGNTHGDYIISQLICDDNKVKGVIDWTTACTHPLIWEIMRSYIFMAPECKDGDLNIKKLEQYIITYQKTGCLNTYDIENAGNLFFYFLAVCDFYGQYYQSLARNRTIYIEQAKLCKKMLVWFSKHIDELNIQLKRIAKENSK